MSALKPFLFFVLGPILGFVATWVMCLGSRPGDACGDMVMILVPIFILIGIILSIGSMIYNVRKGNQNISNNTVEVSKVGLGWGRILLSILVGLIFIALFSFFLDYLFLFLEKYSKLYITNHANIIAVFYSVFYFILHIIKYPIMFVVFYFVFRKVAYY